jgi:predicted transcriptional regulator
MRRIATRRNAKSRPTAKQKALAAIEKLPSDATIEDAIERLLFLAKIERGLAEVEDGRGIEHDEVTRRLRR